MNVYDLIVPLGIVTYSLVLLAVVTGLFGRKIGAKLKHHKAIAILAIVAASIHAALAIILY